jgi:hypothetical protein
MLEPAKAVLSGWENFYVIVGSSGAALIGLQFVVIALVADTGAARNGDAIKAFGTPTIIHLGGALTISAIMSAPWPAVSAVSIALGVGGIIGLGYVFRVWGRARGQTGYQPVWEDWLWHVILPFIVYATLGVCAILLPRNYTWPMFAVAGAAFSLLLIGIHNAWDTVLYIVLTAPQGDNN